MTIALPSSPAPTPTHANSNTTLDTLLMSEDGSKGRVAATQHAAVLSPPGPPSLFLRLANLLVAAAVIVVVHMSERSWVFGHTRYSDEVLAANNLATPARFAWFFWIPVTIYLLVWSVSQVHPTSYDAAANTAHNPIGSMFLVYGVSVIAWQLLWNFGMVPVALIALVGATFSVLTIYSRIKHNLPRPIPKRFLFTLHIPFGMSTAWTLSSLFFTVFSLGLATKNAQLVEPTAALGSILLGFAHIALAIYGRDPVPAAVAIFSQVTLHVAHTGNAVMMPVTATMIGMAVVTFVGMILLMTGVWAKVVVGREVGGQDEYEHV